MNDDIKTALENGASVDDMPTPKSKTEKAWCKKHPTAYIGKNQFGHWYDTCTWGHREELAGHIPSCEIIVERGDKNE